MNRLYEIFTILQDYAKELEDTGKILDEDGNDVLNEILFEIKMIQKDLGK